MKKKSLGIKIIPTVHYAPGQMLAGTSEDYGEEEVEFFEYECEYCSHTSRDEIEIKNCERRCIIREKQLKCKHKNKNYHVSEDNLLICYCLDCNIRFEGIDIGYNNLHTCYPEEYEMLQQCLQTIWEKHGESK